MRCLSCGNGIGQSETYCNRCGAAVGEANGEAAVDSGGPDGHVLRCPSCKIEVVERADFCLSCGEPLTKSAGDRRRSSQYREAGGQARKRGPSVVQRLVDGAKSKDGSDDLQYGQMVIIAARWILVASGLMLALWLPGDIVDLRVQIVVILGLAVANLYLHTQVLMKRPVLAPFVYLASLADLTAISMIIVAQGGFASQLYVFYFPAILAFSVAFSTEMTLAYAGATIAAYGLIAFATFTGNSPEVIAVRLLMLGAVAICGNVYWRNERQRRGEAEAVRQELRAQVQERVTSS